MSLNLVDKKIIGIFSIFLLFALVGASRLPTVSGDLDAWGTVLNDYLSVSLDASGYIRNASVNTTYIALSNITEGLMGPLAVNTTHIRLSNITAGLIAPSAINLTHLATAVLNKSLNASNLTVANFTINSTLGTSITGLQIGIGTCNTAVSFPVVFQFIPTVFCNTVNITAGGLGSSCSPGVPTVTGFTPYCTMNGVGAAETTNKTNWIAIARMA
ncbi:MAG: hypothetical protein V1722_02155 [Candidatus Micrarchaeota archaeon]